MEIEKENQTRGPHVLRMLLHTLYFGYFFRCPCRRRHRRCRLLVCRGGILWLWEVYFCNVNGKI